MEMQTDWNQTYNAAMDSVTLLERGKSDYMSDSDWEGCVQRNVDHLKIIVKKDWPEGFDLTPFEDAIAASS